jgi:branched-chain amino acid aminotransferase
MNLPAFDDRDGFIWLNGSCVPWREARVHVLNHGLHYGSCVFDGERAYEGRIFRSMDHSRRLLRSAELLDMLVPYNVAQLEAAKSQILELAGGGDKYLRSFAWRGSEMMALGSQGSSIHVAVAAWPWPSLFDAETKMEGIRLDIAAYRRPGPDCVPVQAKAGGFYVTGTLSKHAAERKGCADALMLDCEGSIAECTGANIFFIADGVLHTPTADRFLDGITRQTIIELAGHRNIRVIERRIATDELPGFSECFICGTAAEITPVSRIGSHGFEPGRMTQMLVDAYASRVREPQGSNSEHYPGAVAQKFKKSAARLS